jgi:hypothetical protein
MTKMFYSFDDGNLYHLHEHCDLDTLMHEQFTQNGVLIYAEKDKFELVEYNGGREVEFDTRFLVALDDGTVVLRKTRNVEQKPKTVRDVLRDMNKDVDDFFSFIDGMIAGE